MKKLFLLCMLMWFPLNLQANEQPTAEFAEKVAALEAQHGGHIGIAAVNLEDGRKLEYRADERFLMCSTFKLPLVAAVLSRVDAGTEQLNRMISYDSTDMLSYAPITKQHLAEGKMSVADLSAAAIEYSDNTAANLLFKTIGGPSGLTKYVASLGDNTSQFDRTEPRLNVGATGDKRDTTTPAAFVETMRKMLTANQLSEASRDQLNSWLIGNTTGDTRLRAGFDKSWKAGDKTGTGEGGETNDVAIVWPQGKKPFLVAVFYAGSVESVEKRSAVLAELGRMVAVRFIRLTE